MPNSLISWNWQLDGWIVVAGALCALSCALLGNFLVLRKMSMMGDAISHAVLPGLAVAFLITGSRESWPMFIGAAIVGVLTAVFTQWINRFGKVDESAAMGVVFTGLFALGLILIVRAADKVDLDPGCVLYGALETIAGEAIGGGIPPTVIKLGAIFCINALFVILFYKELKLSSFDPELSTTLGKNATFLHYALMSLVAMTTVASFEMVGSVLVVAMLIVPPATAYLLTRQLRWMILLSLAIALISASLGHYTALRAPGWFGFGENVSTLTSGMMAVIAGLLFLLAMLFSPQYGVVSRMFHQAMLAIRIAREDLLGLLYRAEEARSTVATPTATAVALRSLWTAHEIGPIVARAARAGLVRGGQIINAGAGEYRLTDAGRDAARRLVRSHRLWEGYLASEANLPIDHVHAPAERLEHVTDDALREQLADEIHRPAIDPQGKVIPPT